MNRQEIQATIDAIQKILDAREAWRYAKAHENDPIPPVPPIDIDQGDGPTPMPVDPNLLQPKMPPMPGDQDKKTKYNDPNNLRDQIKQVDIDGVDTDVKPPTSQGGDPDDSNNSQDQQNNDQNKQKNDDKQDSDQNKDNKDKKDSQDDQKSGSSNKASDGDEKDDNTKDNQGSGNGSNSDFTEDQLKAWNEIMRKFDNVNAFTEDDLDELIKKLQSGQTTL